MHDFNIGLKQNVNRLIEAYLIAFVLGSWYGYLI